MADISETPDYSLLRRITATLLGLLAPTAVVIWGELAVAGCCASRSVDVQTIAMDLLIVGGFGCAGAISAACASGKDRLPLNLHAIIIVGLLALATLSALSEGQPQDILKLLLVASASLASETIVYHSVIRYRTG